MFRFKFKAALMVAAALALAGCDVTSGDNPGPMARAFSGTVTAFYQGQRITIDDASTIPAGLRGYVQLALDQGLINARFTVTQGPFDLQPTLHAYFDPNKLVTRAAYAVAAGRYLADYQSAED